MIKLYIKKNPNPLAELGFPNGLLKLKQKDFLSGLRAALCYHTNCILCYLCYRNIDEKTGDPIPMSQIPKDYKDMFPDSDVKEYYAGKFPKSNVEEFIERLRYDYKSYLRMEEDD